MGIGSFLRPAVSNGHQVEQALVRKWWYETHAARGMLVWEYFLEGRFVDAIWFPVDSATGREEPGLGAPKKFPLVGHSVVICEAKLSLNPELIGQGLVYTRLALRAGAVVDETVIFAQEADDAMAEVAVELGLKVVICRV